MNDAPVKENKKTSSPLGMRVLFLVVLFSSLITILLTAMQLFFDYRNDISGIRQNISQVRVSNAASLGASLWKLDEEQLRLQLQGIMQVPDMQFVRVESEDLGSVMLGKVLPGESLTVSFPLTYEDGGGTVVLGALEISASLQGVYQRLWDKLLIIIGAQAIKTFLVSGFILLVLHLLVTRHLIQLAEYSRDVNIQDASRPLMLSGLDRKEGVQDELSILVDGINKMFRTVGESHTALQKSHDTLEARVDQRTKELIEAKERAEAASQAKSDFLAAVNHELRTPLTAIQGALGLIKGEVMGVVPEAMKGPVDIANRNTQQLLMLVTDILDFSKHESGDFDVNCAPLAVKAFLKKVVECNQPYAERYHIRLFMLEKPEDFLIEADVHRLMQVMNNLISNAIKFSPEKSTVEIAVRKKSKRMIEISVKDQGAGIAPQFKETIFQKFTQLDSSSSRIASGTGLGLSIVKMIVEKHGGHVYFSSREGEGSTFFIELPLVA